MTALFAAVWLLRAGLGEALSWMLATTATALWFAAAPYLLLGTHERTLARRLLSTSPLRLFGKYSYGLYVVHLLIQQLVQPAIARQLGPFLPYNAVALVSGLGTVAIALAAAMVLFHAVE